MKFAIAALLGSVQSAASILQDNGVAANPWPIFSDYAAPANAAAATTLAGKMTFEVAKFGTFACIRQKLTAVWAQRVDAALAPIDAKDAGSAAQTQAFWAHDDGSLLQAQSVNYECCAQTYTAKADCKALLADATSNKARLLRDIKDNAGAYYTATAKQSGGAAIAVLPQVWNTDLVLAASWQNKAICTSAQVTALDGKKVTLTAKAITYRSKCTYKLTSAKAKGAPSFKLTAATKTDFQLQWMEWRAGALTATVPAADAAPYHMGTYVGEWPHPVASVAAGATALGKADAPSLIDAKTVATSNWTNKAPYKIEYSTSAANCASVFSTQCNKMRTFNEVSTAMTAYNTRVNAYNTALTTYNTAATAYNSAVAKEKARRADALKGAFDPAIAIPTQPCPPESVAAFTGLAADFTGKVALTQAQKDANIGTWTAGTSTAASTYKHGYLQFSKDGAAADINAGHVFGILGQEAKWPATWSVTTTKAAFTWMDNAVQHEMLVSVLPYKAALTATSDVTLDAINLGFTTFANQVAATPSATAKTALTVLGAKTLAVSAVAVSAVLATL